MYCHRKSWNIGTGSSNVCLCICPVKYNVKSPVFGLGHIIYFYNSKICIVTFGYASA